MGFTRRHHLRCCQQGELRGGTAIHGRFRRLLRKLCPAETRSNGTSADPIVSLKDEIFHIRQAQTYCAGRWTQWDPKLTTPPGL